MIVLFINCKLFPFINWIIAGLKVYETRNKNMLSGLIGKRVYIAETGKHKKPLIRCMATITEHIVIDSVSVYETLRSDTMIVPGSDFDWKQNTKHKHLYRLENVVPVPAFEIPDGGIRHGRTYIEYL